MVLFLQGLSVLSPTKLAIMGNVKKSFYIWEGKTMKQAYHTADLLLAGLLVLYVVLSVLH